MPRYKPLTKDAVIDPEVALIQGALALDAAAEVAEKLNDVEGLLNVSAMWMKFSEGISNFSDKVEQDEAKNSTPIGEIVRTNPAKIEMGFQCPAPEVDPITVEEDEEIDD